MAKMVEAKLEIALSAEDSEENVEMVRAALRELIDQFNQNRRAALTGQGMKVETVTLCAQGKDR